MITVVGYRLTPETNPPVNLGTHPRCQTEVTTICAIKSFKGTSIDEKNHAVDTLASWVFIAKEIMEFTCLILQIQSPTPDYQTLTSLGKKIFGRIPTKGESVKLGHTYYHIYNVCHTPDERYPAEIFVKPIIVKNNV